MHDRIFVDCLNKQRKAYNCSFGSIVGCLTLTVLFGVGKGLMWGLGAGAVGYSIGGWISDKWHKGELQSVIYKNIPFSRIWLGKHIPPSCNKYEL